MALAAVAMGIATAAAYGKPSQEGGEPRLPHCDSIHDGWEYALPDDTYLRCVLSDCSIVIDAGSKCALLYGFGEKWGWQHHYRTIPR